MTNWQREFGVWAPEVPVMMIEGDHAKRSWQWSLPNVPLRIANYELLLRDRDPLIGNHFDLVVLDESQRIKNRNSSTSEIVRSIPRKRNWALTGTPVENSAEDLLGIFEFLAPGFLSPDMKPRCIGRTIRDHVLRRTKDQVLADLPPKLIHDEPLDLTPEQRESYRLAEDEGIVRLTELGEGATIQHVFELVLRLKQICNFDPATGASTKFERLEADLEEIADSGRKAIVFSQWVGTLKNLAERLDRFGPLEYHGQVPQRRRDAVIQQFRDDPSRHVILMSYGAGGVGLNLQFVNYVFLFDRWWNPAVEDQAINRAHRIGVDGPVNVTRFLMLDTIEERIDRVLQEKRELFDIIFSGAEGRRKLGLTQEELFGLFRLKCPSGPIDLAA
jgi:SNF2 family DNA or RNA helicase